eukprot:g2031.t1
MVPFKQAFLGNDVREYSKAVSSQVCVRAGGKHNDLDVVGFTPRHHTLFEMLGNFSFGKEAYFKEEAIVLAWDFLIRELELPSSRLRVTVLEGDEESTELWRKVSNLPSDRIVRLPAEENFWSMGPTGPCGPCSEIFWDQGNNIVDENDRWLEIWNLVFMQQNRLENGNLEPLELKGVDTGMGLERIASVLQGKQSNYETDGFLPIVSAVRKLVLEKGKGHDLNLNVERSAVHVIADHLRAATYLLTDGVFPGTQGRGYVLRRIIRRAVRYGHQLGLREPFLAQLVPTLLALQVGEGGLQLVGDKIDVVTSVLDGEERGFFGTLERGLLLLGKEMREKTKNNVLSSDIVFKLYDTFGFPTDLTAIICRENEIEIDENAVHTLMEEQRSLARLDGGVSTAAGGASGVSEETQEWQRQGISCEFNGYATVQIDGCDAPPEQVCSVVAVSPDGKIVIDPVPFFPRGGGQNSDIGHIEVLPKDDSSLSTAFVVTHVEKPYENCVQLQVENRNGIDIMNELPPGTLVRAVVSPEHRHSSAIHHTSTHMIHAALREELGTHVAQAGSNVGPKRFTFDFTHHASLTRSQLDAVERRVNAVALANLPVSFTITSLENARRMNAIANFEEKYGEEVRVVDIGSGENVFSRELCGGTHVRHSGLTFPIKVIRDTSVAVGTRRLEVVAGPSAVNWYETQRKELSLIAQALKVEPADALGRTSKLLNTVSKLNGEVKAFRDICTSEPSNPSTSFHSSSLLNNSLSSHFPVWVHELPSVLGAATMRRRGEVLLKRHAKDNVAHILICGDNICVACGESTKDSGGHAGEILRALDMSLRKTLTSEEKKISGGGNQKLAQGRILVENQFENPTKLVQMLKNL